LRFPHAVLRAFQTPTIEERRKPDLGPGAGIARKFPNGDLHRSMHLDVMFLKIIHHRPHGLGALIKSSHEIGAFLDLLPR
jgi:hypothetical protein